MPNLYVILVSAAAALAMTGPAAAQSSSSTLPSTSEFSSDQQPEIGAGSPFYHPYHYQPPPLANSDAGASVDPAPRGAITGYGAGGMQYAPGSAPNAPHFYGGAGGRS